MFRISQLLTQSLTVETERARPAWLATSRARSVHRGTRGIFLFKLHELKAARPRIDVIKIKTRSFRQHVFYIFYFVFVENFSIEKRIEIWNPIHSIIPNIYKNRGSHGYGYGSLYWGHTSYRWEEIGGRSPSQILLLLCSVQWDSKPFENSVEIWIIESMSCD